jgi:hypothetical protein
MTKISWTDVSWNPVRGCSKVSAGCQHCYAESMAARFSGPGMPFEGSEIEPRSDLDFPWQPPKEPVARAFRQSSDLVENKNA